MEALEKFKFSAKWVEYGDKIATDEERLSYYRTISQYAFGDIDTPQEIKGEVLEYFNQYIRPSLDVVRKVGNNGKKR